MEWGHNGLMRNELWRRAAPFLLLAAFLGGCAGRERPSVLLITIDTLRADRLGAAGNPRIMTPVLDRLSQRSLCFSQAYCQIPATVPSHASLFTSLFPPETGMFTNDDSLGSEALTLAEFLRAHGYRKEEFPNGPIRFPCGLEQGFEVFPTIDLARAAARASAPVPAPWPSWSSWPRRGGLRCGRVAWR